MKTKRLIQILQKMNPDTEIMCRVSTDDLAQLTNMPLVDIVALVTNMTLVDIEALEKYEISAVLGADDNDKYCRLLIKKTSYQYNPKGVRNK